MSLNIKNEHVHQLARKAASKTGLSQTGVIERALEEYLSRLDSDPQRIAADRMEAMEHIVVEFGKHLTPARRRALDTDDLYDADGLPR
ncbi:type II toxin-antitoxin system VapB family antitoxin [Arthrobacter sp. H5]|uniref:type II toxin-antitoxin system VapB family antitoxin n=1 Tax=Arthrobacter sp. H5 TaxID=1267973 RepID=UPI00048A1D95|nr:type II toxin-antitoxin system VapB family antitoxin [Arthrobacter sp. H5]